MALGLNMCNLVVLVLTTVEDCTIHHISTVFKGKSYHLESWRVRNVFLIPCFVDEHFVENL